MWCDRDRSLLRIKWLYTVRRWKRLNLDSFLRASCFLLLLFFFWFLCYGAITSLCRTVTEIDVIGPLVLGRIVSIGFFAASIVITGGYILTAYSSLFRSRELPKLIESPYPLSSLFRIQSLETLLLGGWISGLFCIPVVIAYGLELNAPWWYYPSVLVGLTGFLILSGAIGILAIVVIARWIIGRPWRSVVASIAVLVSFFGLVIYTAILNQELFSHFDVTRLGEALANLRLSSNPYLPSHWMAQLMQSAKANDFSQALFYLFLLWTTAGCFWSIALELGHRCYADGWLWTQDRVRFFQRHREHRTFRPKHFWLYKLLPRDVASIVYKEIHIFARDFSQWGQMVLILMLVLFYVAHTQNASFGMAESDTRVHLVLINLVLLGFIQATLALRYAFPSISLEGQAFWTVSSSKIGFARFYFTKYYFHVTILLIIGQSMGYALNRILNIDPTLNAISIFVLFLFSFGFTSWAMGFGAVFHKFEAASAADVTSDTGALVTMILTLLYFGGSIAFVFRFGLDYVQGVDLVGQFALQPSLILVCAVFLFIQTCAILLPAAYGLKKLEETIS